MTLFYYCDKNKNKNNPPPIKIYQKYVDYRSFWHIGLNWMMTVKLTFLLETMDLLKIAICPDQVTNVMIVHALFVLVKVVIIAIEHN